MGSIRKTFHVANEYLGLHVGENRAVLTSDGRQQPFLLAKDSPLLEGVKFTERQLAAEIANKAQAPYVGNMAVRHLAYCDQGEAPVFLAAGQLLDTEPRNEDMHGLLINTGVLNQVMHAAFGREGTADKYVVVEDVWRVDVAVPGYAGSSEATPFTSAFGRLTW